MDIHQKEGAVLVTGTSTGIGKATALHLERLGFKVFASVRNQGDAQELTAQASGGLVPVIMDITDRASIDSAREQVSQAIGAAGLAGLVNNAGVGFIAPLECLPLDELRWMFEVNVFGLLAVTQAFLPLLRQGQGRLVNISSTATIFVVPFHGPYTASKLSVNGLSNALRLELKPLGVGVSLVVCGNIKTPMWGKGDILTERVSKRFPPQAQVLYGDHFQKFRKFFFKLGKAGIPPEVASRQIAHALTARRPKNTYFVGPDAKFFNIADKFLYGRLRDWVILHAAG